MIKSNIQKAPVCSGVFLFIAVLISFGFTSIIPSNGNKGLIEILSYNIHYGLGMDRKYDLKRIAKVIVSHDPDIVGLQEIGDSTMAAELGRLTGMRAVFGQSLGRMDGYGDAKISAILTGDLNATPESAPLKKLEEKGGGVQKTLGKEQKTIGSKNSKKQIDYVLFRPNNSWKVVDVEVLDEPIASDHLPILMTLELLF